VGEEINQNRQEESRGWMANGHAKERRQRNERTNERTTNRDILTELIVGYIHQWGWTRTRETEVYVDLLVVINISFSFLDTLLLHFGKQRQG